MPTKIKKTAVPQALAASQIFNESEYKGHKPEFKSVIEFRFHWLIFTPNEDNVKRVLKKM